MFNYPCYFWHYVSSFKLFGLRIPYLRFVYCQDTKFNPIYWATNYYKPNLDDYCYYCYEDYEENPDDDFYCYDDYHEYSAYDDIEDDDIEPGLLDDRYDNGLLICSFVQRINGYTALASQHILIADIDCQNDMKVSLDILREYVVKNDACFKVYKTLNGMRYIQLDTIYQNVNRSAIDVLKHLGSDPKYIDFCRNDGRFMARVTPKTTSEGMKKYLTYAIAGQDNNVRTCVAICYMGDTSKVNSSAQLFLDIHDRLTNTKAEDLPLG